MSPARVAFSAASLFALVRFFVTPTWPCAFVVAVALVLCFWYEVACASAKARAVEEAKSKEDGLRSEVAQKFDFAFSVDAALRKDLDETRAKVDNLSSRRAFGG